MASQNTSSLIGEIYKSRNILIELIKRQGYNISDEENCSINKINTMKTNNQLDMLFKKDNNSYEEEEKGVENKVEQKIYVKYSIIKSSLRPANLQEIVDDLFLVEGVLTTNDTLLIVVKNEVNETLVNTLKHYWESEKIFIIIIPLKRLQFNVLDSIYVPPHRVLSESEKIYIKNKYNITDDNEFPEISRFDPVAQAIGIRPGEVCEITRPSKTAISHNVYRICIS
jgi:DNA-directed RNA polymerase subunit H (RpoH/RPB5)